MPGFNLSSWTERGVASLRDSPGIDDELADMAESSAAFHGHLCPGLAVGIIASRMALRDARRAEDEELVAVVENDACGVDAVQAITGCTYGKGNFIHLDHGKSVFTFHNRKTGEALRLSLKPDVYGGGNRERTDELFGKMRDGTITEDELNEFWEGHIERTRLILERGDDIFVSSTVREEPPERARIFESVPCDSCKEPVMATRVVEKDGMKLCIPCSEGTNGGGTVS